MFPLSTLTSSLTRLLNISISSFTPTSTSITSATLGEDGYEISMPPEHAVRITRALLDSQGVLPAGEGGSGQQHARECITATT